jgi:hypothetical protein
MTPFNLWVAQRWERGEMGRVHSVIVIDTRRRDRSSASHRVEIQIDIAPLFSAELPYVVAGNRGGPKSDSWTALSTSRNAHCIATNTHK